MGRDVTPAAGYASAGTLRTLAVRINHDLRAQLDLIAQLNERSVTEEIRVALKSWVETTKSDPKTHLERLPPFALSGHDDAITLSRVT